MLALASTAAFHLGFLVVPLCWLVLVYLATLFALRRAPTPRWAFYPGLAIGLGIFGPELGFFWTIFGPAAMALWMILALWHGIYLLLMQRIQHRWGSRRALWLAPVVWLGIEFFRSELYYLRFSWLTPGSALPVGLSAPALPWVGVYGVGAMLMLLAASLVSLVEAGAGAARAGAGRAQPIAAAIGVVLLMLAMGLTPRVGNSAQTEPVALPVVGLQLEFPGPPEVLAHLRRLPKDHPPGDVVVLSEYTFDGPVPDNVKAWCRKERRWFIAGGKEPLPGGRFYNTAYVIDTNGVVAWQQVKAVPIPFFKDGEPAPKQSVWPSPWGDVGLCVCYDLNYARVIDRLVEKGARALIVPTMDVESWGLQEHRLNARLAPIRAAEHGLPIFRVASSGISQLIDARGRTLATGSFPGPGETLVGQLTWDRMQRTTIPLDRYAGPAASFATAALALGLILLPWRHRHAPTLNPQPSTLNSL